MPPKKLVNRSNNEIDEEMPGYFSVFRDIFMANMPRWSQSVNQTINQSMYTTKKGKHLTKDQLANQSNNQSNNQTINLKFFVKWSLWLIGLIFCYREDFGSIYLICTAIYLIFTNLSDDSDSQSTETSDNQSTNQSNNQSTKQSAKQKLSAYAAFNHGVRIPGSLSMGSFEQNWSSTSQPDDQSNNQSIQQANKPLPKRTSKAANEKCVCGSGKKFKLCCSPARVDSKAVRLAEEREAREMWGVDE